MKYFWQHTRAYIFQPNGIKEFPTVGHLKIFRFSLNSILLKYGRELPPKVYVPCFYSNFLYSWCLIVILHACALLSFLFLFILYYWLYGNCHQKSMYLAFILICFIIERFYHKKYSCEISKLYHSLFKSN